MKIIDYCLKWLLEKINLLLFLALILGVTGIYLRCFSEITKFNIFSVQIDKSYIEHIIYGFVLPTYLIFWQPLGAVVKHFGIPKNQFVMYFAGITTIIASLVWEYEQFRGTASYAATPGQFQYFQFSGDVLGVLIWIFFIASIKKSSSMKKIINNCA